VTDVFAVRYGTLRSTRSAMYHRFESYGEPDGEQRLDYYFWIVRDGQRSIVIDTGFDPDVAARRGRTCLCQPREALVRLGVDPASVPLVLLTHFHYDHVGNLDLFPQAELVVPERELQFWTGPIARRAQFAHHVEPAEIERVAAARRQGRVRTIAGRTEIAPGVTSITVGGHSPGQQVVIVEASSGPVVLASDAVHFYEELEQDRPFAVIADLEAMYAAYDTLRHLARLTAGQVVPGHDADVMTRFPGVGGDAADLAVRLA
jgi:glyoxylase-like metal-dependent hydrolase (beta-lactamase superfamily II)